MSDSLFRDRTPEAAARQLAVVLAYATECALATVEQANERKSTSRRDLARFSVIAENLVLHCCELGVPPRGLSGNGCPRLAERLRTATTGPARQSSQQTDSACPSCGLMQGNNAYCPDLYHSGAEDR